MALQVGIAKRERMLAWRLPTTVKHPSVINALRSAVSRVAIKAIENGADPNEKADISDYKIPGDEVRDVTPLMLAGQTPDIVVALLNRGANPHAVDSDGWTALHHLATIRGREYKECAEWRDLRNSMTLFLDVGVDVNVSTAEGITPLHLAVTYNNLLVAPLLAAGAAPLAMTLATTTIGKHKVKAATSAISLADRWKRTRPLVKSLSGSRTKRN